MNTEKSSDPRLHATRIRNMLKDAQDHTREDVTRVNDPRARALFEVTAEVLQGLVKAYEDYEQGTEAAWH